ncbi:hypothetical protein [Arhodomonas sp. AD133]|uniref:hypothetical protein n=1 Tax=Arhodomonas sp. AD133 TaxID=3415009 RepID=UPI003EB6984D
MSVRCQTFCVDCNVEAPEIGDGGVFGTPSLAVTAIPDDDWGGTAYTFGWLYDGLSALGLRPYDIEAYRAFLREHDGHDVRLTTDHDDDEPPLDWAALTRFEWPRDGFVPCYYELEEPVTGARCRTEVVDLLVPLDETTLTPAAVARAVHRLFEDSDALEGVANVSPLLHPDEELGRIQDFIEAHQQTPLIARTIEAR